MTTLAQQFLTGARSPLSDGDDDAMRVMKEWTNDFVRKKLLLPTSSAGADEYAERFVFEVNAPEVVDDLIRAGSVSSRIIQETTTLPWPNVWIEYPVKEESMKIGFLVAAARVGSTVLAAQRTMLAIVGGHGDNCRVVGLATVKSLSRDATLLMHWYRDSSAPDLDEDDRSGFKQFAFEVMDCLFLINTPRVATTRPSSFGRRDKRTGLAPPDRPFVEYKRITLNVGVAAPRYDRAAGTADAAAREDARRRKLHRVIGHFRTYEKDRETPHVAFVPDHWRGDADLGIILHERTVKT